MKIHRMTSRFAPGTLVLLALLLIAGCKEEPPPELYRPSAEDLIASWEVDEEAMKDEIGFNPAERLIFEVLKETRIEFDGQTITAHVDIMGESKSFSGNYRVVRAEENRLIVAGSGESALAEESTVEFITRDQIRLIGLQPGEEAEVSEQDQLPLIMRRAQQ